MLAGDKFKRFLLLLRRVPQIIAQKGGFRRSSAAVLHVYRREGFAGIKYRIKRLQVFLPADQPVIDQFTGPIFNVSEGGCCVVLTTRHCEFVARQIERVLARVNVSTRIINECPVKGYEDVPHLVICPQMFEILPDHYVAFQLEQLHSSQWFTTEYFTLLKNSAAILDYSIRNIGIMQHCGLSYHQIYYVPLSYDETIADEYGSDNNEDIDVLFYGDPTSKRRREAINRLSRCFNVVVASEVYGQKLHRLLKRAKVVVNIHYYEGALLETTRIYECLSRGRLVVSERASDMDEHHTLEEIVDFVEVGDFEALESRVARWLNDPDGRKAKLQLNETVLKSLPRLFDFYFLRFLLATGNISFDEFYELAATEYQFSDEGIVCLSLPESVERRTAFVEATNGKVSLFPGLRHQLGWLGCGMSYKFLTRSARDLGFARLLVCEDDVEFPENWQARIEQVTRYLATTPHKWDFFCGMSADLSYWLKVTRVEQVEGVKYVYINTMNSMVMTIFNRSSFSMLSDWDERDQSCNTNTIDRFLESLDQITVVTTIPFLVGHRDEQPSTLWSAQNVPYRHLLAASEKLLEHKVQRFSKVRPL